MSTLQDTDIFLVNRGGKSYKAPWSEIKGEFGPTGTAPKITSLVLTASDPDPTGSRFTNQEFVAELTMEEEGDPISVKTFISYVQGAFNKRLETDVITAWDDASSTLTLASDKNLASFNSGDVVRQDETVLDLNWASFDADGTNTYNGGNNSALAQDTTQTYIVVAKGSTPL